MSCYRLVRRVGYLIVSVSTLAPVEVTKSPNNPKETTTNVNSSVSISNSSDSRYADGESLPPPPQQQQPSGNTPTTQPPASVTPAGKTKRDDGPAVQTAPDNPMPMPERQRAAPPHHIDVTFTSTVQHHVTAFIAWQQSAVPCDDASDSEQSGMTSSSSAVVGFRLRYGSTAVSTSTPNELSLSSNVAAIDGLLPEDEYWYQVCYVFDDGSQSPWTDRQILQT